MNQIGPHKRVVHYDGAFECLDCHEIWGVIANPHPVIPAECSMTTTERSETPRNITGEQRAFELRLIERADTAERELSALRSERDAQWTVLKLLFERFPDCACIGDLPGCVDELRLRYTWKPMKYAPYKKLLLHFPDGEVGIGFHEDFIPADGWMEIP